jgi:hypothetical protein
MDVNGKDRKLMRKYGFKSDFAYRTFMAMKGERMEYDGKHNQRTDWTLKKVETAWPHAV